MNAKIVVGSLIIGCSLLVGCSTVAKLQSGADQVVVSQKLPSANCKKLVYVTATQNGQYIPAQSLEQGAMNQLRNVAYQQGANYVYLEQNYANFFRPGYGNTSVSSVVVGGDAYSCP
ncbi:MAG: hypothetical protein A3E87_02885 [Gammaproteobacteria bacterium RIFCSPHIGHO2_12_FULL_35_23]|nr:MAG: hypothetical protein A3E87_02885 [Gammaproteobacteria bacterium RIFCSPHIGHO2_12_FULL_35_23]